MQAQERLVISPSRSVAIAVASAATLVAAALAVALMIAVHPLAAITPPAATIAHQEAPDAQERNDLYAEKLSAPPRDQSPDAKERNAALTHP